MAKIVTPIILILILSSCIIVVSSLSYPLAKTEEANKEVIIKELRVKGVLLSGNDPMALVGDRIVKIGDKIGAHIIKDINRKGILLSHGNKIILIPLE